jgi:hypothetical protein
VKRADNRGRTLFQVTSKAQVSPSMWAIRIVYTDVTVALDRDEAPAAERHGR